MVDTTVLYWKVQWNASQLSQIDKVCEFEGERNHITTLELWVLVVNFLLFGNIPVLGGGGRCHELEFMVDNSAADVMVAKLRTKRSSKANKLLKNLILIQQRYASTCSSVIKSCWLERDLNQEADDLSKNNISNFEASVRQDRPGKLLTFEEVKVPQEAFDWIFN